jgi:putative ABC transport system ATP-binding protein
MTKIGSFGLFTRPSRIVIWNVSFTRAEGWDMPDTVRRPLIEARKLTKIYRLGTSEVVGINNIDFNVPERELLVLKGNSGSGKSTLLALLAGLDQPTHGDLMVANQDIRKATQAELTQYRRKVVGIVFQSFNLLPTLTILENVCLPSLLAGQRRPKVIAKAMDLLEWLHLIPRLHHLPAQLSGGEMQRTAIARALINEPAIILADEPTGNLDSQNGKAVMELLGKLNHELGTTVIIATHSDLADPIATTTIRLRDGSITDWICTA